MPSEKRELPDPTAVIAAVYDLDPSLRQICVNGSCYRFYLLLKTIFPEAVPYMNIQRDHVVTKIGQDLYDISGKLPKKRHADYHEMSPKEIEIASKWGHRRKIAI